jgi:ribonuclease-3
VLIFRAIKLLLAPKKKHNFELVKLLGFIPTNLELYELAFVHRSASLVLSKDSTVNNERLEFLGDAVLDAVIAEYLFLSYPDKDEGFLSKMRSKIVKRKQLNSLAISLGIDKFVVAHAINQNGGKNICGNAFEALIGAIYLDKGYAKTHDFIINKVLKVVINLNELENTETDFKSRLIEWSQKNKAELSFESQEEYTRKDYSPLFVSRVIISNHLMGEGIGSSKKEAEQNAAENALLEIEGIRNL